MAQIVSQDTIKLYALFSPCAHTYLCAYISVCPCSILRYNNN